MKQDEETLNLSGDRPQTPTSCQGCILISKLNQTPLTKVSIVLSEKNFTEKLFIYKINLQTFGILQLINLRSVEDMSMYI